MNLLLIGCLLVVIICAAVGYKRGLVKVLFSLISFLLIMLVVGIISPVIGNVLQEKTSLHQTISGKCMEVVQEWNVAGDSESAEGRLQLIDQYQFPDSIKQYLKEDTALTALETDFTSYISGKMADLVMDAIAYVIAFIVVWIAFRIIAGVLDLVAKLPVLRSLNHLGGVIAGCAQGVLIIWIFFLVVTVFCTSSWGNWCMEMIAQSEILTYIYDKNIILRFIPGLKVL